MYLRVPLKAFKQSRPPQTLLSHHQLVCITPFMTLAQNPLGRKNSGLVSSPQARTYPSYLSSFIHLFFIPQSTLPALVNPSLSLNNTLLLRISQPLDIGIRSWDSKDCCAVFEDTTIPAPFLRRQHQLYPSLYLQSTIPQSFDR